MCGIVGFFGPLAPEHLAAMSQSVAHRGPDGSGEFVDAVAGVALGHRRLAIIDLSDAARQPLAGEDGSVRVVVNGEIYNHLDLRRELERRGHRFSSHSDSEVVVHLYEEWGPDGLSRLEGMFALGLWDGRHRRLLLARDRFGIKPLYWTRLADGTVAFASELKALAGLPGLDRSLDLEALHLHLSLIWCPAPRTLFEHVHKLEPGCLVEVDADGVRHRRWWRSPFDGSELDLSDAALAAETRRLLDAAVARQMMSDVPVGAFLSGGLDSTSVVALMRRHAACPVPCYTMAVAGRPDEKQHDLPYARDASRALGVELREVEVDADVLHHTDAMVQALDEPLADPAALNVGLIARAARADGVPVLLSGAGGDDLFGGYGRHLALAIDDITGRVPTPVWRGLGRLAARGSVDTPVIRRTRKFLDSAHLSADDRVAGMFVWHPASIVTPLYTPATAAAVAGFDAIGPLVEGLAEIPAEHRRLDRMLFLEQRHFLADHNLTYTDKLSMQHGIEVRVPFLDTELATFAARLPRRSKQRGRRLKGVLRDAVADIVPAPVVRRPKTGFGAPLRRWVREDLRPMIDEVLAPAAVEARGIFDPRAVRDLVERNQRGEVDAAYLIYSLTCTELWLRHFHDRPVAA